MLARNFKSFQRWNVHHHTSSPDHPKGNGTAEAAVKQAKRILKMSRDPWMAILEQRNTPDELASPNEKLKLNPCGHKAVWSEENLTDPT